VVLDPYKRYAAEQAIINGGLLQLRSDNRLPFAGEAIISAKVYNVVLQVLERMQKRVSWEPWNLRSERYASGVHVQIEVQQIVPPGTEAMECDSAVIWFEQDGLIAIEWLMQGPTEIASRGRLHPQAGSDSTSL
jgi:hypothetical protein